jgi:hypothetical protein
VYVEAALYPSICLLKIGRDVMPIPHGWTGNYCIFTTPVYFCVSLFINLLLISSAQKNVLWLSKGKTPFTALFLTIFEALC